jgi:5-formyltetrahydrofolate cyclo-ligase
VTIRGFLFVSLSKMQPDIQAAKTALRKQIRGVRQNVSPETRASASAKIRARLQEQPFWKAATAILFFAPLPGEVDVWPLLAEALVAGKTAALPRFDSQSQSYVPCQVHQLPEEIVTGRFGIREPARVCPKIPLLTLDLILVPGVAFDLSGRRLGRGQGFYDRLLAGGRCLKCGVAFEEQIVPAIPVEPLDVRMDFILTPTRLVKAAG